MSHSTVEFWSSEVSGYQQKAQATICTTLETRQRNLSTKMSAYPLHIPEEEKEEYRWERSPLELQQQREKKSKKRSSASEFIKGDIERASWSTLAKHNFIGWELFPDFRPNSYIHEVQYNLRVKRMYVFEDTKLPGVISYESVECTLPTFGTTSPVQQCIKFLMSRVHQGMLWLDEPYPFTLEHVRDLIGLSMDGLEVSTMFQQHKRGRTSTEGDLYPRHGTF